MLQVGADPRAQELVEASPAGPRAQEADPPSHRSLSARLHRSRPRDRAGRLVVEAARVIMVALLAVGGWEVAAALTQSESLRLVGIVLGAATGYVAGGVFGRRTASAVTDLERASARVPASELLSGGVGLLMALCLAALVSIPLFHLPPAAAFPTIAFVYVTTGYAGYRLGRARSDDLFALFGVKARSAGTRPGEVAVLDSSVILDPRTLNLVRLGFLGGVLLVPRAVVGEVQAVADSSDPVRRRRGQRGLDLLVALTHEPGVEVTIIEDLGIAPGDSVDAAVVRLARTRSAILLTNDGNLAKVAAAVDVPVRSIHVLADAVRPPLAVGDTVMLRLSRPGRASGQAVGYLEDGTMVVVEAAGHRLGQTVEVAVTNALQTSTGRLLFGRLPEAESADSPPSAG